MNVIAGFALTLALAGAARADDLPDVTTKICLAASSISSFVIQMSINGTAGVSSRTTFVRPLRMKSVTTFGAISTESYLVDDTLYVHSPLIGWRKMTIGQAKATAQSMNIADTLKTAKVTYLPDRQEGGETVGVFQVESQLPGLAGAALVGPPGSAATAPATQSITCTFDKSTYRMETCANSTVTMTYSNYDDPANRVELPDEAKTATPLVWPMPGAPNPSSS